MQVIFASFVLAVFCGTNAMNVMRPIRPIPRHRVNPALRIAPSQPVPQRVLIQAHVPISPVKPTGALAKAALTYIRQPAVLKKIGLLLAAASAGTGGGALASIGQDNIAGTKGVAINLTTDASQQNTALYGEPGPFTNQNIKDFVENQHLMSVIDLVNSSSPGISGANSNCWIIIGSFGFATVVCSVVICCVCCRRTKNSQKPSDDSETRIDQGARGTAKSTTEASDCDEN